MALRRILNTRHYKLITPIDTPGIYHNSDLGLISLSSDGSNWITIADKNLGATQVRNDGDTLSQANCGTYFQRGNNYGFPRTGNVPKITTKPNTNNYGPGNYYSSSNFIQAGTTPYDWSNTKNDNLWGGVTGTMAAMQGPCSSGFHVGTSNEFNNIDGILTSLGVQTEYKASTLKIPLAGYRSGSNTSTVPASQGNAGYYWLSDTRNNDAYDFVVRTTQYMLSLAARSNGYSIRPFKNEAVIPDSTWTKLY